MKAEHGEYAKGYEAGLAAVEKAWPEMKAQLLALRGLCPKCKTKQDHNGLMAWCEQGHIYNLTKRDPRYSEQ